MTGESSDLAAVVRERDAALRRARELEHEVGRLRGQVARLESLSAWRRSWRRLASAATHRVATVLERSR
jgi:hypothetical protein